MSFTDTIADNKVEIKKKTKQKLAPPSQFKVIYMNDDTTTVEFVIESLITIFAHDYTSAYDLTGVIHNEGNAVVAVLPYEMAEQKGVEVTQLARNNGFPLVIKLEADE